MSLLSPWSLVWLAVGAAILWLYTLKPRSRRVEVSSTLLWLGALKEETARSLIQWLKRHLLLLLQLLIALLGVFALARPALVRSQPVGRTVVLAIDASASMLANDGDPAAAGLRGPPPATYTRFDEARARAEQAVAQLQPGDRVIVLRVADRAEVAAQGTIPADREALETAIRRLQVLPSSLDLAQAFEVADALARSARLGQVVLFTGGVADPSTVTHRPAVALQIVEVGKGQADNQAITQFAARRDGAGDLEVFGRLRNFSDQPASGTLRVYVDGELYQEQPVTLGANESFPFVLREFPPSASIIEARFVRRDLLALDNVATAAAAVPPVRKVLLVGGRSDQLERALRAVPGVELAKADPQTYDPRGGYDVYVFEGWFPAKPPPGHWVLIDPPTWAPGLNVAGTLGRRTEGNQEVNDAQIARVLPSPLLDGVDLTGVSITEAKKVSLPDWAEEVVSAREAPLIFMGYPGPYRAVVFSFDLRSSNLFGRVGFPVLIANVVNWLTGEPTAGAAGAAGTGQFVPGDALLIQPLPRTTRVVVETPSKRHYEFNGNQPVRFLDTGLPGAYTVTQYAGGQQLDRRVYVASILQPENESAIADLHPRDGVPALATIGGASAQPATIVLGPGFERVPGEWWRLLGVLALAGLFAEWWWFHR